jgi:hypothetical protein
LEQLGDSGDTNLIYWVVWTCIVGPDAIADPSLLVSLLEKVSPAASKSFGFLPAATLYRSGQLEEAISKLQVTGEAADDAVTALESLFLAMAYYRKGRVDEAHRYLDVATMHIQAHDKVHAGDAIWPHWRDWVACRCLLREAEALINGRQADLSR